MGSNWFFRQPCDRFFCLDPKVGHDSVCDVPPRVDRDTARRLSRKRHPTPNRSPHALFFRARQFAPVNTAPENHAINPEKFTPRIRATPVRRPIAASCPSVLNLNGFFGLPSTLAMMLCARTLPSRDACCAVGGQKSPVAGSGTSAQSPSAQRPSWPLDLEMRIHFDSTAFLGTRDKIQDWVW